MINCNTPNGQVTLTATSNPAGTYLWTTADGHIVSGATSLSVIVDKAGTYTFTSTSANGCSNSDAAVVTQQPCTVAICTYTQGAYGSAGGKMCDGKGNQYSTIAAIRKAIDAYPGDQIVLGTATRSVVIRLVDAQYVLDYLPGGGNSYALKHSGALLINTLPPTTPNFRSLYTTMVGNSRYKINNTLLAQTLTLALNVGFSSNLAAFELQGGKYLVTLATTSCGSNTPASCSYKNTWIDASVVNKLGANKTVGGLLDLANRALAGENVGVSLTAIARVVDAINNAFDGCRLFASYSATPVSCPALTVAAPSAKDISEDVMVKKPTVNAFPNPFTDKLRFVINSPVSGQASLELYNMLGQKVRVIYQGFLTAGVNQIVEYSVPAVHQVNLTYRLTLNGDQVSGKLMNARQ